MLAFERISIRTLEGANNQFMYFCNHNFFIHAIHEMKFFDNIDFFLHNNEINEVFRYIKCN